MNMAAFIFQGSTHYESQLICLKTTCIYLYIYILYRHVPAQHTSPVHHSSSINGIDPLCFLIFIKSISTDSVTIALQHTHLPAKSILIDHHWLSWMSIDPVQTHAQGLFKTQSSHSSLMSKGLSSPSLLYYPRNYFWFSYQRTITILTESKRLVAEGMYLLLFDISLRITIQRVHCTKQFWDRHLYMMKDKYKILKVRNLNKKQKGYMEISIRCFIVFKADK